MLALAMGEIATDTGSRNIIECVTRTGTSGATNMNFGGGSQVAPADVMIPELVDPERPSFATPQRAVRGRGNRWADGRLT